MISDKLKAQAIAQLRSGYEVFTVVKDLEIPESLVEDWYNTLDANNLVALEAVAIAVQRVENGEVMPGNDEVLKETLEQTAIGLVKQVAVLGGWGDMAAVKSIQLCADAVTKMYTTMVFKNSSSIDIVNPGASTGLGAFTSKMKD